MADSAPSSKVHQKLIDRLSNLPEPILLHILSFLPTKTAVATSVLSKPWQHLWTLVPAIDLNDYEDARGYFEDTVIKVLDSNKAPIIRRFRLKGRDCTDYCLAKFLSSATKPNVEELELVFRWVENHDPHRNYTFCCPPESCESLVVLKVMPDDLTHVIGNLHFPKLKILHTSSAVFKSRNPSLSGFYPSLFPVLEELVVHPNEFLLDINISLSVLRRLETDCVFSNQEYTLNVEAPSLQYLGIRKFDSNGELRVGNLPKLVEANVEVLYNTLESFLECLINILNVLSNVRMLNLSLDMFQSHRDAPFHSFFHADRIQPFRNLVKLDLQLDRPLLLGITVIMLSKFEKLEHLKIEESEKDMTKCRLALPTPTHVPNCLTYHLKTFCFRYFEGSTYGMEFTIYILKNSLVLENVKMFFSRRVAWKKGRQCETILSTTPRGSSECQLEFDQEASEFEYDNKREEYYYKRWDK